MRILFLKKKTIMPTFSSNIDIVPDYNALIFVNLS